MSWKRQNQPGRKSSRDASRDFRSDPRGKVCACGRTAVKFGAGAWGCQRCLTIEAQLYRYQVERVGGGHLWMHRLAQEVNEALDRYWERKGIPEPQTEFIPSRVA